jgi:HEAT repeat protein
VSADPARVNELAKLATDPDWLVSMRALDLLEKIAHEHAERVQPHKRMFIGAAAESDKWEVRLQVVRALPLLHWTPRERARVVAILRENLDHPQTFVRAWALDGLATFAEREASLVSVVRQALAEFDRSGSKALSARARHVRTRLGDLLTLRQRR